MNQVGEEIYSRRYQVLFVLMLVNLCNYMDRSILVVLIEPIKAELKISDTQAGLLSGFTFAIFYATFGIPLARLADRSSRVRILSAAIMLWSVMTALSGLARSYVHLLVARVGVAVGEAGGVPASHSLIGDYFPQRERAFAISIFQACGFIGIVVGFSLAGVIAEAWGWRSTFLIMGAPGIVVGILVLLTVREPARRDVKTGTLAAPGDKSLFAAIASLLRGRAYRHVLTAMALENFVTLGFGAWAAAFFIRVHGLGLAEAGLWLGFSSGVGSICGILVGGALSVRLISRDRRWEVWMPATSAALAFPLYLTTFLSPITGVAIGSLFATAFIAALGGGVSMSSVQSVTPARHRALAVALMMFTSALIGLGAGPLVIGMLSDALQAEFGRYSLRYALLPVLVVLAWSITHFLIASRHFREDAANKES